MSNCVECGSVLRGRKKKFCSESCHSNHHLKYMAEYYKKIKQR